MNRTPGIDPLAQSTGAGQPLRRLLHDLKQPLNLIRVLAQEIRLDVRKDRLDLPALPERMAEIEQAVDQVVAGLDALRELAVQQAGPGPAEPGEEPTR